MRGAAGCCHSGQIDAAPAHSADAAIRSVGDADGHRNVLQERVEKTGLRVGLGDCERERVFGQFVLVDVRQGAGPAHDAVVAVMAGLAG
jgi:hypothetical protein